MEPDPCIKILKALADPTRWQIVSELLRAPLTMSELTVQLDATQYNISKHVRILREAGLVSTRKEGKNVACGIEPALCAKFNAAQTILDLGCCTFRFDKESNCRCSK